MLLPFLGNPRMHFNKYIQQRARTIFVNNCLSDTVTSSFPSVTNLHLAHVLLLLPADERPQLGQLGQQVLVGILERFHPLPVFEIFRNENFHPTFQLVHVFLLFPSAFLGGDLVLDLPSDFLERLFFGFGERKPSWDRVAFSQEGALLFLRQD